METNAVYTEEIVKHTDILCAQEHWLFSYQKEMMKDQLNMHGIVRAVDDENPIPPVRKPRGMGGVAILWHDRINHMVKPQDDGNTRIVVCTISPPFQKKICLINCYLPSVNGTAKKRLYEADLDLLNEIITKYESSHTVMLTGDMNCDLFARKRNSLRKPFINLLKSHNLFVLADGTKPTMILKDGSAQSHLDVFATNYLGMITS